MLKLILKYRNYLIDKGTHKKCFKCNKVKRLNKFSINNGKYQRPSQKGRCFNCKKCVKEENKIILWVKNIILKILSKVRKRK